ncbi:hypothetical protein F66182_13548, partial [Fusarium sp. NRRL 66182]
MKSQTLAVGLILATGLQKASAGHQHGGQHAHFNKNPVSQEYATTTTTTTSIVEVTTITSTITVTPRVDESTTTPVAEVSPTSPSSEPPVYSAASSAFSDSEAGSAVPVTIADVQGSSTTSTSRSHTSTSKPTHTKSRTTSSHTSTTIRAVSSTSSLTPNGIKAGSAGGDAYPFWSSHIGWWYDWTPAPLKNYPDNTGSPIPVAMLWGDGTVSSGDALRYHEFLSLSTAPQYILGYEEPDCAPPDSADISSEKGAELWNEVVAPWKGKGKQSDEDWLTPFEADITTSWDFTAIHINTISMDVVNKDL